MQIYIHDEADLKNTIWSGQRMFSPSYSHNPMTEIIHLHEIYQLMSVSDFVIW